jgi:hypothetical protein
MIIEQYIGYWVSLAPYSTFGTRPAEPVDGKTTRHCMLFPLHFMNTSNMNPKHLKGVSDFKIDSNSTSILNMSFTISANFRLREDQYVFFSFSDSATNKTVKSKRNSTGLIVRSQKVRQIWYYDWKDFVVPPPTDFAV